LHETVRQSISDTRISLSLVYIAYTKLTYPAFPGALRHGKVATIDSAIRVFSNLFGWSTLQQHQQSTITKLHQKS